MKIRNTFVGLMALFLFSFNSISAQNYFQTINPGDITDPVASSRLTALLSSSDFTLHELVSLVNFENYVEGAILSLTLPNGSTPTNFTVINSFARSNGDYLWLGNNDELGYFIYSRINGRVQADLPDNSGEQRYKLVGLNEQQGVLLSKVPFPEDGVGCTVGTEEEPPEEEMGNDLLHSQIVQRTEGCPGNEIRILYLYTQEAVDSGLPIENAAEEITEHLNTAIVNSEVSGFSFTTAAIELLSGFTEGNKPNKSEAKKVRDNATAASLRTQWKADVVLLFGAYAGSKHHFGNVIDVETTKENAFGVAKLSESADMTNMIGSHEISHMLGARHQQVGNCCSFLSSCSADGTPSKAHGFKTENDYKDLLTAIKCDAERRINWSNPEVDYMGEPTGKRRANNAAQVEAYAPTVACFYPEYVEPPTGGGKELEVSINGLFHLKTNKMYTWESKVSGGTPPYTVRWYTGTHSGGAFTLIHTGSTLTRNSNSLPSGFFVLRCEVTDAVQDVALLDRIVINGGFGGWENSGQIEPTLTPNTKTVKTSPVVSPNPTAQDLQILNCLGCQSYEIMNASGQIVQSGKLDQASKTALITMPNWERGMYWIRLMYDDQETRSLKFIKQ